MDDFRKMLTLFAIIIQVFVGLSNGAGHGSRTDKFDYRNVTVSCPKGSKFKDGYCYKTITAKLTWQEASTSCSRMGMYLVRIKDEMDGDFVNTLLPEGTIFWTGFKRQSSDKGMWTGESEMTYLHDVWWSNYQPQLSDDKMCGAIKSGTYKNGNIFLTSCNTNSYAYICQSSALPKDAFHCYSGEGVSPKLMCNGFSDCMDGSDEAHCSSFCHHEEEGNAGSFNIAYESKKHCIYSIESDPGTRLKIEVKAITRIEKRADSLKIYVGAKTLKWATYLKDVMEDISTQRVYYSASNYVVLVFSTDSDVKRNPITVTWTTTIPEIPSSRSVALTATSTPKELMSPFFATGGPLPLNYIQDWVITTNDNKGFITIKFEEFDLDDAELYGWDGDVLSSKRMFYFKDKDEVPDQALYHSFNSKVIIRLITSSSEESKGFKLTYKQGANEVIKMKKGMLESPGFNIGMYPNQVTATWTIQRPNEVTTGMSAQIKMFDLYKDSDFLKAYEVVNATYNKALHSGSGYTGTEGLNMIFRAQSGSMKFEFTSSKSLTARGFSIKFSVDCPALNVSKWTNYTGDNYRMFNSQVNLQCEPGYTFMQEEYKDMENVSVDCLEGGMWNKERIPNCGIRYCGIPSKVSNGFVLSSSGVTYQKNVTYQCNGGFSLIGNATIYCQADGSWDSVPKCESQACSTLPVVGNGEIKNLTNTTENFADVIEFVCKDGYETVGPTKAYCQTSGNWSHNVPTCIKKVCPLPMIKNGNVVSSKGVEYDDTVTVKCNSGYHINGSAASVTQMEVKCGSDRMLSPMVVCVDIDECTVSNPCNATQNCVDKDGGYECPCKPGYEGDSCTNINECDTEMKMGCSHICNDTEPGYSCSCYSGYELYMYDGFNDIKLAEGETGMRIGDKRYINHTCVRKTCDLPPHPMNGTRLSKNITYYYEDTVYFRCDRGFVNVGGHNVTCMASGNWSSPAPVCQEQTCTVPSSVPGPFVNSTPSLSSKMSVDDTLMILCMYGDEYLYRTLHCNTGSRLEGDEPMCPEIDCGTPEAVQGSNITTNSTTLGANFTFSCDDGYQVSGYSQDSNYVVQCKKDGLWSFGNLTCIGQKCEDPGTPGGAEQVAESYELNLMVSFNCTRYGYFPDPPYPFQCVLDNGKAKWNATTLPLCKDMTKPKFSGCTSHINIQKGTAIDFTPPTVTDNSGALKNVTVYPEIKPGDIILEDTNITYTAEDYDGNMQTCTTVVKIYMVSIPSINCPNTTHVVKINTTEGVTVTSRNIAPLSPNSLGVPTYNPANVKVDVSTVGTMQKVVVSANNEAGFTSECNFYVLTEAVACFEQNLPMVDNSSRSCNTVNGTVTCSVKCDSNFAYQDGNITKEYTCTGANQWSPTLPPAPCLTFTNPSFSMEFKSTIEISGTPAVGCKTEFDTEAKKDANLQKVSDFLKSKCSNLGTFEMETTFSSVTTDSFKFLASYTVKFKDNSIQDILKTTCSTTLDALGKVGILDFRPVEQLVCSSTNRALTQKTTAREKSGNNCPTGMTKTKLADGNDQCISCPPGTFVKEDQCEKCEAGKYQDLSGQTVCKSCPAMTIANSDQSGCIDTCPKGFISDNKLPPCQPCPSDYYWKNATYCEQCPNNGSTINVLGAESTSECKAQCAAGTFSKTGFEPCTACPLHHYQESMGMMYCTSCKSDQITVNNGTSNSSYCIDGAAAICPANVTHCNGKGTCYVKNHRKMCNCTAGYTGENCENKQNPCDAKPCFNNGTCQATGDDFTCTCPVKKICDFEVFNKTKGVEAEAKLLQQSTNLEQCRKTCEDSEACLSFSHFNTFCYIYEVVTTFSPSTDQTAYNKTCSDVQLFNGSHCQFDIRDACTPSTCGEHGMCQDLVPRDEFKCLCPRTGEFTGSRCTRQDYNCTGYCMHGGTCTAYGSVRRQCKCKKGYTGDQCQINTDECKMNADGCMNNGTCKDGVFSYSCQCDGQFSGKNCEKPPNYCQTDGCGVNALCYNDFMNFKSVCVCDKGYKKGGNGKCEMIDACDGVTCMYNGTCQAGKCKCMDGYEGSMCQHNIDDCKSSPCKNMGTCQDGLMNYTCKCMKGYTGYNCSTNIDDCVGKCMNNSMNCTDKLNDYQCNCKHGWKGKDCLEEINECMAYPCEHNSTCEDKDGDYMCKCTQGWSGKNCDIPTDYCNSTVTCLNGGQCFNMSDDFFCRCPGGTKGKKCEDFPSVCSRIKACSSTGECYDSEGTAKCNCTSDYTGDSCELVKQHCKDSSLCGSDGKCKNKDVGYMCECNTGFSGMACKTYADPCKASPAKCPVSGSSCISYKEDYFCYCKGGDTLTDVQCKDADEDKDIQFNRYVGLEGATLETPVVMQDSSALSIFMWVRFSMEDISGNSTLLGLESRKIEKPRASVDSGDKPEYFLELTESFLIMKNGSDTVNISLGRNIADKTWQPIGLSWKSNGEFHLVVRGSVNPVKRTVTGDIPKIFQAVIAKNMNGRISRLKMYNTLISETKFIRTISSNVSEPEGIAESSIVQSFTNFKLKKGARYHFPNKIDKDVCDQGLEADTCGTKSSDSKTVTASCPKDKMVVETDRIAEIKNFITEMKGAFGNQNVTIYHTLPEDESYLSGHRYNEISFAVDSNQNFAFCLVRLYIKYNDVCPAPKTDATVNFCNNKSGDICGMTCSENKSLSMPSPNKRPCGTLGVYDYMMPHTPYVLPTCGEEEQKKYTVTLKFQYKLAVTCADGLKNDIHTNLLSDILNKLKAKKDKWSGLCDNTCSNIQTSYACIGTNLGITVTFKHITDMISRMDFPSASNTTKYTPKEALMVLICEDKEFDFTSRAGAKVESDTIEVSKEASCSPSFALVNDKCVKCGAGTFYNSTSMMCQRCPIGQYQNSTGQTECMSCAGSGTTLFKGACGSDDCVDKCSVGYFYNMTSNQCNKCPKNFYQDEEGQSGCKKCHLGKITTGPGAKTANECADDCPSGTERKTTCVPCKVGYYRTQKEDLCVPCDDDSFTTTDTGSKSVSECNIKKCPPGSYRYKNTSNSNIEECVVCEVGYYQPESLKTQCIKCDGNFTTEGTNSTMKSQCKFYCLAGKEKVDGKNECRSCPRGKYRTSQKIMTFMPCAPCSNGSTTDEEGATSKNMCSLDVCEAGQELNSTKNCVDCPYDKYQSVAVASTKDKCKPCDANHATENMKSSSKADCKFKCGAGKQLSGSNNCVMCPRGTYRDGSRENYFKNCTDCQSDKTTDGEGSIMSSNCSFEICVKGQELNSTGHCVDCPYDYYQPVKDAMSTDKCKKCDENYATMTMKSAEKSDCKLFCPAGKQMNDASKCEDCPRGTFRTLAEGRGNLFAKCANCTGGKTTEGVGSNHADNCSIEVCTAGQELDNSKKCVDCMEDKYQMKDMPTSADKCQPCGDKKGTKEKKSNSSSLCLDICLAGQEYNSAQSKCIPCKKGFWSNGNNTMRFMQCASCPENYTTTAEGSIDPQTNCTLLDCPPGSFIKDDKCELCPMGEYQSLRHQTSCEKCGVNLNTTELGAKNALQCQLFCAAGLEGNQTCQACKADYFKSAAGRDSCKQCTGNFTSGAEKKSCNEIFCDKGFKRSGDDCVACPAGKYKDTRGNANACSDCDPEKTTPGVASLAKTACTLNHCNAGRTEKDGKCVPCDKGTYKTDTGNQACTNCSSDKTTTGTGSTTSDSCSIKVCNKGEKWVTGNNCEQCEIGTFQSMSGQEKCETCKNGKTTLKKGSDKEDDCIPKCKTGEQYVAVSKACEKCPLGYYKSVEGSTQLCTKCPTGNTTLETGSDSLSDCSAADCGKGSYRAVATSTGCKLCDKNFYQDQTSQTSCTKCPNNKITMEKGADSEDKCILNCDGGKGYNFLTKKCDDCPQNFYTNKSISEVCIKCPAGKHNFAAGSPVCYQCAPCIVPSSKFVVLKLRLKFIITFDCTITTTLQVVVEQTKNKVKERLKNRPLNYNFCSDSECSNIGRITITVESCGASSGRKKRATNQDLNLDVSVPNVPRDVTSSSSGQTESAASVANRDLATNSAEYTPPGMTLDLAGSNVPEPSVVCGEGQIVLANNTCDTCGKGTYKFSGDTCTACPVDTYQDESGKTSCKKCSDKSQVKLYTINSESTVESDCVSMCTKDTSYCKNGGQCKEGQSDVFCTCTERYSGARCDKFMEPESSKMTYVGIGVGVTAAVLLLVAVVIGICCFGRNNKSNGSKKLMDEEMYTNPLQQYPHHYYETSSDRNGRGHYALNNTGFNVAEDVEVDNHLNPQLYDNFYNKQNEEQVDFFQPRIL